MTTLSIYQKTCPRCLAILSVSAQRCECGHRFQAGEAESDAREDASAQEEELFRAYLAARLEQAVSTLEEARAELAADPDNFDKARHVMKVLHDVLELRAELASLGEPSAAGNPGSAQPTEEFRAAQAARAAATMERLGKLATRECPVCHAVLPASCARCFCGHLFASGVRSPRPGPSRQPAKD